MNYLKDSIHDLVGHCNIVVVISISKVLAKYLKGSILDLVKHCLCLSNVFSNVLAKYLRDGILDLVDCCLSLQCFLI